MKKILLLAMVAAVAIILLASVSWGAPFLGCDVPPTGFTPTQVQVEIAVGTGAPTANAGIMVTSGTNFEIYDLAPLRIFI